MAAEFGRAGLDVGSTTAKLFITDNAGNPLFSLYRRHGADIANTLAQMFTQAHATLGDRPLELCVTGSAGMGIAERSGVPFVQEVIAAGEVTRRYFPQVRVLIDIGGEDSKMIFFSADRPPDIRMNGSCAGGTGAFIDQMAALLNISLEELNSLAEQHRAIHPIASRCGVFAKTDVQNLVSRNIDLTDICASILHAVVVQTINTLARGVQIEPEVLLCGGPLTFLSGLRERLHACLSFDAHQCRLADNGLFLPAWGATLVEQKDLPAASLAEWCRRILTPTGSTTEERQKNHLPALFGGSGDFSRWQADRHVVHLERITPAAAEAPLFLGIDSGSTTAKVMVIDARERVVFHDYRANHGKPLEAVLAALQGYHQNVAGPAALPAISTGAVTGYGEDLIRAALDLDLGVVETLAHWKAAAMCDPEVSFILDIGGQDMKAIFIKDQGISRIEINEACSSGCGSFIEGFANSLGLTAASFAEHACRATAPCDLGTRCTVFMNSRIKQAQREEAPVEDISAGLAYSVIKNSLYKVLKLRDPSELGGHIVAQGGTFRNPAVHKALEELTGQRVKSSDLPEMMGALGAALLARQAYEAGACSARPMDLDGVADAERYRTRQIGCKGCTNQCTVTVFSFDEHRKYYVGNKCERIFTNQGAARRRGENFFTRKNQLLFERAEQPVPGNPQITIGIPRILQIFEAFPFWHTLLTECGLNVILSDESTQAICDKGMGSVMSDNICFPAKLAHGHMVDLVEKGVDRIFYPQVVHESPEDRQAANSYNCPIVCGYADVLKGAALMGGGATVPIDAPPVTFRDERLLRKATFVYLKSLKVKRACFERAFERALETQRRFHTDLKEQGGALLQQARRGKQPIVILAGRPYHADRLIEHQTSEMLADLGALVLPVETAAALHTGSAQDLVTVAQWAFPNRLLRATQWVASQSDPRIQMVMLNSFGCGPDAFIMDEVRDVLAAAGKIFTLIKVDDISSTGSVRLRLRSLIETLQWRPTVRETQTTPRKRTPLYRVEDRAKRIIAPYFADCYSPFFAPLFGILGYDVEILPPPDITSVEYGLKYANNEICYPATVVIGDIVKAFKSGAHVPEQTVVAMTQTGGQCRASSYVALIRKALIDAGFDQVPVIALANDGDIANEQPGFTFDTRRVLKPAFAAMLYADGISKLYHRSIVREKMTGQALALRDHYLTLGRRSIGNAPPEQLLELLQQATAAFNTVVHKDLELPRIGLVGEIYLKYNQFSQQHVTDWIITQGVEVVVPSLIDFIMQFFVNLKINRRHHIERRSLSFLAEFLLERQAGQWIKRFDRAMHGFHYYEPTVGIYQKAGSAAEIINLVTQFGEGWLIPAEIACYAKEGINEVVSLQPFGCTSNHVIAKGIETRVKRVYPDMNLLFLDFDAGASEVNLLNRLHFLVSTARDRTMAKAYSAGGC